MNGKDFLRLIEEAFVPFLAQLGFVKGETSISGRCYSTDFNSQSHQLCISYEPGDDQFFFIIGETVNGRMIDIDDRSRTSRLSDLNYRFMGDVNSEEHTENENYFTSVLASNKEEHQMVKAAKELRLVIPRYMRHNASFLP